MEFNSPTRRQYLRIMQEDRELYVGISKILKQKGISTVINDDCLLFTAWDGILRIEDEKIIINDHYWEIDFEIPIVGERLKTIRLANPDCFDQVRRFCNDQR